MDNYEVIGQISKGSFGVVSKIRRKSDNKVLVWKELNYGKMSEREKQQLVSEVNILRELKHPNIVRYYDRIIDKKETKIYIVMEYCEGGDMSVLLKKCKKDKDFIDEDVIWKIFTQIVLALNECHNRKGGKVLHRDIKPANIFLDSQNNIKLGDFGLSRVMGENSVFAYTHVGTPYYMSPEQINEQKYNEKSDIWSAGCLLYEMAALKPPFEAQNHLTLALKIKDGKFERLPMRYSEELQKVIQLMLQINVEARVSVTQLLEIPQISLRIKERQLRDRHSKIKAEEEKVKLKEQELQNFENVIMKNKEKNIANLQSEIQKLESIIFLQESELKSLSTVVSNNNSCLFTKPTAVTENKIVESKIIEMGSTQQLFNSKQSEKNLNRTENLQLKHWNQFTSTDGVIENKIKRSESYKCRQGLNLINEVKVGNLPYKITQNSPYNGKIGNYFSERLKMNPDSKQGSQCQKQQDISNTLTDADTNCTEKTSINNNSKFKRSTTSSTLSVQSNSGTIKNYLTGNNIRMKNFYLNNTTKNINLSQDQADNNKITVSSKYKQQLPILLRQ